MQILVFEAIVVLFLIFVTLAVIFDRDLFDEIIYPDGFEKYYFKAAIPARNRYMVNSAAYAICYVTHDWGGAAKTYEYAKKKKLTIIDLPYAEQSAIRAGK